eukprot:Blabericola_migrator_1__1846@NODE_1500_length_4404_cov_54_217662_g599_i2_p3_GENE_NODE_1500_length_4404_cov_54_217662_g599_i2NODE_1500_length_4404_cov_54_217662_g599_i2_p3_ORF_typecomplete_len186_score21_37_NODE_1500_length_4404_cov_54_217662_g599_i26371194
MVSLDSSHNVQFSACLLSFSSSCCQLSVVAPLGSVQPRSSWECWLGKPAFEMSPEIVDVVLAAVGSTLLAGLGLLLYMVSLKTEYVVEPHQIQNILSPGQTKVALIFIVMRQLDALSVWNRWLLDAQDHEAKLGYSALKVYVHHSPLFVPCKVRELLPPVLNHSLIPHPAFCLPTNVNACLMRIS